MPRLLVLSIMIIVALLVLGGVGLMFVDVPYQPKRVEQPVSNETLGL